MIMGDRDEFVGAHVTPEVKDTLRLAAADRGESMSKFISDAIEQRFESLGIKVLPLGEPGPRLPFEGDECLPQPS
jgi:hypothetical protein